MLPLTQFSPFFVFLGWSFLFPQPLPHSVTQMKTIGSNPHSLSEVTSINHDHYISAGPIISVIIVPVSSLGCLSLTTHILQADPQMLLKWQLLFSEATLCGCLPLKTF